jgi:hypothetical protein
LRQEFVAIAAEIALGHLPRIENGRANSTWTTLERIPRLLRMSIAGLARALEASV